MASRKEASDSGKLIKGKDDRDGSTGAGGRLLIRIGSVVFVGH